MEKYKLYLEEGDEAIATRTAQRYNVPLVQQNDNNEQQQIPEPDTFQSLQDDSIMEVETTELLDDVPNFEESVTINDHMSEAYCDWAESLVTALDDSSEKSDSSNLRPKNLNDFMNSDSFFEKINTPVNKTRGEVFFMALSFCISNHLSVTAMVNVLKLINSIFETPILPDSQYIVDKMLNPKVGVHFHAVCNTCSAYLGEFNEVKNIKTCNVCGNEVTLSKTSDTSYFLIMDPSTQVSDLIHTYENHYDYVVREREHREGYINDVYDGNEYRKFVRSLSDDEKQNYVTCVLNTDGAPIYKSSKYSIWPLFLKLNELPGQERMNKLILAGLWFNKTKPDMSVFLSRFVKVLKNVNVTGIKCTIKDEQRFLKLHIINCCTDSVARAPIQGIKQFNGKEACSWCLHPGEYDRESGCIKYPYIVPQPNPRSHERMKQLMMQDLSKTPIGIKHPSPLLLLDSFNVVTGFVPDYLHSCLEGVGAQFTGYFLDGMDENDIDRLDNRMSKIAVPQQVQRLCRPLSSRNVWKAREWENFILYYSIPLFSAISSKTYVDHWLLFVESLYILLQEEIHIDSLNKCDENLHKFVYQSQELHKIRSMTYNLHQCLHLCECVLNWGPLWTNSTFSFEAANYDVLRAIKCANGVTHQIVRFVNISHSLLLMENRLAENMSLDVKRYCIDVLTAKMKNVCRNNKVTYFGKGEEFDKDLLHYLQQHIEISDEAKLFHKMVKDRCLYESCQKSKMRSNNSYALLEDGNIIHIYGFVVDDISGRELVMCRIVETTRMQIPCTFIKIISTQDECYSFYPVSQIKIICVSMEFRERTYVCALPNLLHY